MLIDFDSVQKLESTEEKLQLLCDLKNDLVGCSDSKQSYFDKGILEIMIPFLAKISSD